MIGLAAEMSTMDMADRSAATTPVSDDLGAACTPPPTAVSAANSLLPPGPPLPDPATLCVPLRNAGLAAGTTLGMDDSMDAMGRILVPDGAGRMQSPATRAWMDGIFSIISQEFRDTYGRDPPMVLTLDGLLPPASPLPNPATKCAPLRTDRPAASNWTTLRWSHVGLWSELGLAAGFSLRWSVHSALSMAAKGALPDDILQTFLPEACLRHSRQFLLNSLAEWGLTFCDLICDATLARARAFWDYDTRLAGKHFDGQNTLAHAEDLLGFYIFGLACSRYLTRARACRCLMQTQHDLLDGVMALQCAKPHELPKYRACLLSVLDGYEQLNSSHRQPPSSKASALGSCLGSGVHRYEFYL